MKGLVKKGNGNKQKKKLRRRSGTHGIVLNTKANTASSTATRSRSQFTYKGDFFRTA